MDTKQVLEAHQLLNLSLLDSFADRNLSTAKRSPSELAEACSAGPPIRGS